jgi:circadian clock protein KaiB
MQLRLYVAGTSLRSTRAVQNAREICDAHLPGGYDLEVIDLLQQPERAKEDQIIAVPVLIKRTPLPLKRILGDLTDRASVIACLEGP